MFGYRLSEAGRPVITDHRSTMWGPRMHGVTLMQRPPARSAWVAVLGGSRGTWPSYSGEPGYSSYFGIPPQGSWDGLSAEGVSFFALIIQQCMRNSFTGCLA